LQDALLGPVWLLPVCCQNHCKSLGGWDCLSPCLSAFLTERTAYSRHFTVPSCACPRLPCVPGSPGAFLTWTLCYPSLLPSAPLFGMQHPSLELWLCRVLWAFGVVCKMRSQPLMSSSPLEIRGHLLPGSQHKRTCGEANKHDLQCWAALSGTPVTPLPPLDLHSSCRGN
jgi:hypothetical protein